MLECTVSDYGSQVADGFAELIMTGLRFAGRWQLIITVEGREDGQNNIITYKMSTAWWHQSMETVSALLALCEQYHTGHWWIPSKRASFAGLCFFVSLNKLLSKESSRGDWRDALTIKWRLCSGLILIVSLFRFVLFCFVLGPQTVAEYDTYNHVLRFASFLLEQPHGCTSRCWWSMRKTCRY